MSAGRRLRPKMRRTLGAAAMLATAAVSACAPAYDGPPRILMDWFPQAEQGGVWQAGIDPHGGSAVRVLPGGPRIQTIPQVAAGESEFGVAPADDILIARMNGAPVKAIAALADHYPFALLYHPRPGVLDVRDLHTRLFAVSLGASYWEWLKATHGLSGARQMPLSGDLTLFRATPDMVQQGLSTTLPFRMQEAGIPVAQIRLADLGYRPYWVLFTRDELLERRPAVARAVTAAIRLGWKRFAADPRAVEAYILNANRQVTAGMQRRTVGATLAELQPRDLSQVGCMKDARWRELAGQLRAGGLLAAGFDERQAYATGWVSECR